MADVKVCVSGYEDDQRYIIKLITKELGGKFTQSMGRSNTHLVLPAATGEKYRHTGTMGVIPVTVDWLLASAAKVCTPILLTIPYAHCQPFLGISLCILIYQAISKSENFAPLTGDEAGGE
jgi:hypothetical protein